MLGGKGTSQMHPSNADCHHSTFLSVHKGSETPGCQAEWNKELEFNSFGLVTCKSKMLETLYKEIDLQGDLTLEL